MKYEEILYSIQQEQAKKNITYSYMAREMKKNPNHIKNNIEGKTIPKITTLLEICDFLNLEIKILAKKK